jgi:glucans biosynthesis protein
MDFGKLLLGLSLLSSLTLTLGQPSQTQITFESIVKKAQERAEKPYKVPKSELPEDLRRLNYDTYREIKFRHEKALWAKENLPFRLEFFHPGYLYETPVKIHEFNATHAQPVRFVEDFFDYGNLKLGKKPGADSGYAGFRLLFQLNAPGEWGEVASFLGASYFRMLGKDLRYGASARGLAIDTGETDLKEEFPVFTEWWIAKPEKDVNTLRFFGLLESGSCAGAYEFFLKPGETTVADVSAVLFFRDVNFKSMGIAPLTSMYWFGENSERKPEDFRPEVHDSDGLLIRQNADELIWRPLGNPASIRRQSFAVKSLRGFGLLQRDREFSHYEDLFNYYQKTPSIWVEPRGDWGEGEVHLLELPANVEYNDNVVAFWSPKEKPAAMQPFKFGYTLHWAAEPDANFSLLKVAQTRIGVEPRDTKKRQIMVDFRVTGEFTEPQPAAVVQAGEGGVVSDVQVLKNELSRSWRVIFSFTPKAENAGSVDIQCALKAGDKPLSEIWKYRWEPLPNKK